MRAIRTGPGGVSSGYGGQLGRFGSEVRGAWRWALGWLSRARVAGWVWALGNMVRMGWRLEQGGSVTCRVFQDDMGFARLSSFTAVELAVMDGELYMDKRDERDERDILRVGTVFRTSRRRVGSSLSLMGCNPGSGSGCFEGAIALQ